MKSDRIPHISALDGLRTLCVFATIATHTSPRWVANGGVGVEIFFVLSGFLITNVLVSELVKYDRLDFSRFYTRRFFRLTPALFLLLAACTANALSLHGLERRARLVGVAVSATYWMNWNKAFHITSDGILGHTWSLSVEEQFYLVFPLILVLLWRALDRERLWLAFLCLALLSDAWRVYLALQGQGDRIYFSSETQAEFVFLGCCLAVAPTFSARFDRLLLIGSPIPAIFLALWTIDRKGPWVFIDSAGYSLIAVSAVWLIYVISLKRDLAILSWPPMTYLGRISYGIYLWHYPISQIVVRYYWGWRALTLISAGGVAAAMLSYHLLERPLLTWWSRWSRVEPKSDQVLQPAMFIS